LHQALARPSGQFLFDAFGSDIDGVGADDRALVRAGVANSYHPALR
jgi:hypothetical protein